MVKGNYLVEKSNVLNAMMGQDISLSELRFFLVYVSRLNPMKPEDRTVSIGIKEFEEFFNIELHTTNFNRSINKILSRSVSIYDGNHISKLNLYSKFEWDVNNTKELLITCNYDVLPYLFELQKNYTTYMIENIAKLNTVSKIRLYEICKQYQKIGTIKLSIDALQDMLCSHMSEFRNFKRKILDIAIEDINKYTDIYVSYTKNLSCRKVVALTFTISKKEILVFSPIEKSAESTETISSIIESLYLRCNKVYTIEQLQMLYEYIESTGVKLNITTENYIYSVYCKVKMDGNSIKNMFKYTKSIVEKQIADYIFAPQKPQEKEDTFYIEPSYNLDEWKKHHGW